MIWAAIGGMAIGVAVGEYYRRIIDRIRREQIADLRRSKVGETEVFDSLERSKRRDGMVSNEQFMEMQVTGHTAGRYKGGKAQ